MFKDYALFDIRIRGIDLEHSTVEVHSELGGDASSDFTSPTADPAYQPLALHAVRTRVRDDIQFADALHRLSDRKHGAYTLGDAGGISRLSS